MNLARTFLLLMFAGMTASAQLGFCPGSKGEPLFFESFGNGTTYGPALPAGTTTYPFVTGAPNDGQYTLFYHSNMYSTWHYSLDHTPDDIDGPNGKMLLMNANATQTGDFYKKTVTGLCVNTTFEFSAWLMNVYNPNTNYCGAGQIPINVRFEIWNASETVLLGSGNTGNIMGSPSPLWQQFALVFTTVNETTVVLKMKNNGLGGCGNDLAIDDISFSACGDLTTVSSPSVAGDSFATCNSSASLELQASTAGSTSYAYQWQMSTDGQNWTDIPGATNAVYTTPYLSSTTFYRVKAAQDAANLNGVCAAVSNVFAISFLGVPDAAVSNGNQSICSGDAIPALSVTTAPGTSVNWYSAASGGVLLLADSLSFTPSSTGTFYAESYNLSTNCIGPRTAVSLVVNALPDATISAPSSVCSGNSATITFNGTPNALVNYIDNLGMNQSATLDSSGSATVMTAALSSNATFTLTSVSLATCIRPKSDSLTIAANQTLSASISANPVVCAGSATAVTISGTPNATVTYSVNSGSAQTVVLDSSGNATLTTSAVNSVMVYELTNISASACSQTLSESVTISAVAIPSATISATQSSVCSGQSATIIFTGTENSIIAYTINGGPILTTTLNASGTASFSTGNLTANATYSLVSATSGQLSSCSQNLIGTATISVNALPIATISADANVCSGSSATVNFSGTPNATVDFLQNASAQTVTLDSTGNASISLPSVTSAIAFTLVQVSLNGCSAALSQSITINPTALPTATISANPTVVCAGQQSTIIFSGTPDANVTYTVNGGVHQITLDASGSAFIADAISANQTYELVSVSLGSCAQTVSGTATVLVNANPDVLFSGNLDYCEGETVSIELSSNFPGTTFSWTSATNGIGGATAGNGNEISQTPWLTSDSTGTIHYTVTPFLNGCAGLPVTIYVGIFPFPKPQLSDGVICTLASAPQSSQFYTLDSNLDATNHSFQWFYEGDEISGAFGSTYNATQIGTYSVIATSDEGCVSDEVFAQVGQMSQGESLQIEQSAAFSDNPRIAVNVVGGSGPFLYQIDDLPFQASNVFENVSAGVHFIRVVDGNCTDLSATVSIIGYPKYFTPNGDGFHDTWNISGIQGKSISIFDRYGKLIKQISTDGPGWDGTYNGSALPSTDYWFVVNYIESGLAKTFKAHFSLKR